MKYKCKKLEKVNKLQWKENIWKGETLFEVKNIIEKLHLHTFEEAKQNCVLLYFLHYSNVSIVYLCSISLEWKFVNIIEKHQTMFK